jgi:broad specificity phosphatase PhoE
VLCAHGGLITALTGYLLELPVTTWAKLGGIGNCHWVVLARRATSGLSWRLIAYNAGITG